MKTIQEKIAVMQAFIEGKKIQLRHFNDSKYYDCTKPGWNWDSYDYRIKPATEYVPFTFEDAEFLIGKPVKHKKDSWVEVITYCNENETSSCMYEDLLRDYTFLDGSPCGKLKQ